MPLYASVTSMQRVELPQSVTLISARLPARRNTTDFSDALTSVLAQVPHDALWIVYSDFRKTLAVGHMRYVVGKTLPDTNDGLSASLWRGLAVRAWRLRAESVSYGRTGHAVEDDWDHSAKNALAEGSRLMGLHFGGYWILDAATRSLAELYRR